MTAASLAAEDPDKGGPGAGESQSEWDERRSERHYARFLMYMVILVAIAALGVGAVAIGRTFLSGDFSAAETDAPAVPAGSVAGPSPDSGAAAGAAGDESSCVLPEGAVTLKVQSVATQTGKADPDMFVVTWDLAVQNTSDAEVTVWSHWTGSGSGSLIEGWTGSGQIVEPGGVVVVSNNLIDNNQSGRAGVLEWNYADRVLALPRAPECSNQHGDPPAELQQNAMVSPLPVLPPGVELPGAP
ncbi:MAG: hypothetical protein GC156_01315 [Actinomycetales bacterium]|nr:hypothetical protein [Actinomycetales bacterium]